MSVPRTETDVEWSDYSAVIRRRWRAVVLGVVVGLFVAVAGIAVIPKTYRSTVSVQVQSVGEDGAVQNGRTSGSLNLDTEAQIVRSTAVAQLAFDALEPDYAATARELVQRVSVAVPPNTSVLNISFLAPTPAAAREGAQQFGESYLANRKEVAESRAGATRQTYEQQLEDAQDQLSTTIERLEGLEEGSPNRPLVAAQRDLLIQQVNSLNSQILQLSTGAVIPGDIITEAQTPTTPTSPNIPILAVSGLLVGLVLGLVAAFALDRADQRVRSRRDLERLGLDALVDRVDVTRIDQSSLSHGTRNIETLRQLRNGLLPRFRGERGTILVAGVSPDETGSAVAFHLAEALARSGVEAIFVCANSEFTGPTRGLVAEGRPGLAELLRGEAEAGDVIVPLRDIENLSVVPTGTSRSLSLEMLQGRRTQAAFEALAECAQVLVVDVAPTASNADAQSIAALGHGVLLVATAGRSERPEVVGGLDQMRHVSAVVLGAVLASVLPSEAGDEVAAAVDADEPAEEADPARGAHVPADRPGETGDEPGGDPPDASEDETSEEPGTVVGEAVPEDRAAEDDGVPDEAEHGADEGAERPVGHADDHDLATAGDAEPSTPVRGPRGSARYRKARARMSGGGARAVGVRQQRPRS